MEPYECPTITFDLEGTVTRAGGDTSLLIPLTEMVERSIGKMTEALDAAIDAGSAKDLEFHAHKLKAQCMTLGAEPASQMCADLEAYGKAGEVETASRVWGRTKQVLENTRRSLLEKLATLRRGGEP